MTENDDDDEPANWYPDGWTWGQSGPEFELRGIRVVLEGGPLAGQTAHMTDREGVLWVARSPEHGLVVTDGTERPALPADANLVGWYRLDEEREALTWTDAGDYERSAG